MVSGDFESEHILARREKKKKCVAGSRRRADLTRIYRPRLTVHRVMDKPKRTKRVIVKTERTYVFRNRDSVRFGWCEECGAEVGMTSVDGAAREAGLSELAIYKLVESRALHFKEDEQGRVLVCLSSLRR